MTRTADAEAPRPAWGRTLAVAFAVGVSGLVLIRADGSGSIPLGSMRELTDWLDGSTPADIAVAGLRLAALAVCGYLAAALVITVVAGLVPHRHLVARLTRLAPAALRRALVCSAGSGLATGVVFSWLGPYAPSAASAEPVTAPAQGDDPAADTATMTKLGPTAPDSLPGAPTTPAGPTSGPPSDSTPLGAGGDPPADPTLGPAPAPAPGATPTTPAMTAPSTSPVERPATSPGATATPSTTATTSTAPATGAPASEPEVVATPTTGDDEWVVAPGESFWSIAEEALRDARGGTQPADEEIASYWRQLIAANRARLSAPDNPDLLHVGQALVLPPPA